MPRLRRHERLPPPRALFVYGSLADGRAPPLIRSALARHARLIGYGSIAARLYDLGPYPGAVPSALPGERVVGRVYALRYSRKLLDLIDKYEQFMPEQPEMSEFVREPVRVAFVPPQRARPLWAWAYFYRRPLLGRRRKLQR